MYYANHFSNFSNLFDLYYSEELDKKELKGILLDLILDSQYQIKDEEPEETLKQILKNQNELENFLSYIVIGHLSYDLWEYISNGFKYED